MISIGAAEVVEGGVLRFPLTRTPADAPVAASLSWSVGGGSAAAGQDFATSSRSLTLLPLGQFTVKVTMTTASGKTLVQTRRYKTCAPKRRG